MSKRAPDGRFVPKTGDAVLPPKKPRPRDEHGHFIPNEKVQSSKPYSRAVRELLDAKEQSTPEGWTQPFTEAQALAMIHVSMAKAGDRQIGLMVIDRAEGKVPQAEEDREAAIKSGVGVKMLAELLGIDMSIPVIDVTPEEEPCLPDVSVIPSLPSESESASDFSSSPSDTSVTSSPESSLPPHTEGTSEDGE